jgi:peptide-N4-(N-acetyl-beta-glucosaminyl)asparagine amidase
MAQPNAQERAGGAGRVEVYTCLRGCQVQTRFPRYNHPGVLMSFRQGRCGEWANAFTLCAVSLGFNARYVSDWTDHVWTEIWSRSGGGQWMHCDSCEDLAGGPLVYESGWGKKLNYIVACSPDEVVDVTRRYTKRWMEVLSRRTLANEISLERAINFLDRNCRPSGRRLRCPMTIFDKIRDQEREFLNKNIMFDDGQRAEGEKIGRISGSKEWVSVRGEDRGDGGESTKKDSTPVYGYEMVTTMSMPANFMSLGVVEEDHVYAIALGM